MNLYLAMILMVRAGGQHVVCEADLYEARNEADALRDARAHILASSPGFKLSDIVREGADDISDKAESFAREWGLL